MRDLRRVGLVGPALGLLTACAPEAPPPAWTFLRGAILVEAPNATGQALSGGRTLLPADWTPGQPYTWHGQTQPAPARASCVSLFSVDLGDVSRLVAAGGESPDTALAWSPTGDRLAIGSYRGELLVVDGWTGEVLVRRQLTEALVKAVAWSLDGETLYAGEQSPDATLRALDPITLADRWTLRLADRLETSAPPPGEDLYGVYSLPAVYGLSVLSTGELIVAGAHGWQEGDTRRNRAQVLRLSPAGVVTAAWPPTPADATLWHPRIREDSGLIAVPVGRSASGPPPTDLPINGVVLLSLSNLALVGAVNLPPLAPYFQQTFLWESVDVAADKLLLGAGDGRVRILDWKSGVTLSTLDVGTPLLAGEVPIAASVGHARFAGPFTLALTSGTNIPYGAAAAALRPPSAHPNENTIWAWNADGSPAFQWTGDWRLQGLSTSPNEQTLVVGAGERSGDRRADLFGALVFDLGGPPRPGDARLQAVCATQGPVFFRQALTNDGRIAVSESPYLDMDRPLGRYQVTVLR